MTEAPPERAHQRHFTREEASAAVPRLEPLLLRLREARDELTDPEVHEILAEAAPTNGGGEHGKQVGNAFLEVRQLVGGLAEAGIVLRDIDRGLVDFPAIIDGREVYLCWQLGEDDVSHWHDLSAGYSGRRPLD